MLAAMAIAAVLCIGIGSFPALFYSILPFQAEFHPYSLDHVVGQVQLLFLSALAFTLLMRTGIYPPELRSTRAMDRGTHASLLAQFSVPGAEAAKSKS